jgi:hypothetical protein
MSKIVISDPPIKEEEVCDICCSYTYLKYDRSDRVICKSCNKDCCKDCYNLYLLEQDLSPQCMFEKCKVKINFETILSSVEKEWFKNIYRRYRSDFLMKKEISQMGNTPGATRAYLSALTIREVSRYKAIHPLILRNALSCIDTYGRGWETFNFDSLIEGVPEALSGFTFGCPVNGCYGFIRQSICNLCSAEVCGECHELLKKNKPHECNPDTLASIKAVYGEAKPCPKCAALISKVSGCDQMFCTQCHTTYSWNTGLVITGPVHNPHYFQWINGIRALEPVVRLLPPGQHNCEEYISYQTLNMCFRSEIIASAKIARNHLPPITDLFAPLPSEDYYYLAFNNFRENILDVRATSGNHANVQPVDNHDLRVKLTVNEITESEMKTMIEERDFEYRKFMSYFNIYMTVYQSAIVIFDNLYAYTRERFKISDKRIRRQSPMRFFFETYVQFQKLIQFANQCLVFNDSVYGSDVRFIQFRTHPFAFRIGKPEDK